MCSLHFLMCCIVVFFTGGSGGHVHPCGGVPDGVGEVWCPCFARAMTAVPAICEFKALSVIFASNISGSGVYV